MEATIQPIKASGGKVLVLKDKKIVKKSKTSLQIPKKLFSKEDGIYYISVSVCKWNPVNKMEKSLQKRIKIK